MRFWQKYIINEYGFGEQVILFAVSDSYEELFTETGPETGTETDIFMLESAKKDLNTEEGSYAIDELPFSINHLACRTDDDEKAMYFCLDAADIKVNRFCAVFFGDSALLANQLFVGKINDKITAEDKIWDDVKYNDVVNPKRDYKLTAYSFDVSILEKVKLWTDGKGIEKPDGTFTDDLYTRACGPLYGDGTPTYAQLQPYFENKLAIGWEANQGNGENGYFAYLGNLYNLLSYFLTKSGDIIYDITNTNIVFNLIESSLGFQVNPTKYGQEVNPENKLLLMMEMAAELSQKIEVKLSGTDSGSGWSSVFINRKMIAPEIPFEKSSSNNYELEEFQKEQMANELDYSFKSKDNIAELLFEIARSFGVYLFMNYGSGNNINLEYKSRADLVENNYTYIINANKAQLDTSSVLSSNEDVNEYYAVANNYASDDFDIVAQNGEFGILHNDAMVSNKYNALMEKIKKDEKKGLKTKRLLLNTSPCRLYSSWRPNNDLVFPLNYSGQIQMPWVYKSFVSKNARDFFGDPEKYWFPREYLHAGIYITLPPFESTGDKASYYEKNQINLLGSTPIWRPAVRVYTKINGINKYYDTLASYINQLSGYDKFYYETEYTLTVPSWNGFSKSTDGSGASWDNIKLGSKIKLTETVQRYDGANWRSENVTRDYVVVGIEINLQKPETKLKLHNRERFAFGTWDGVESSDYGSAPPLGDGKLDIVRTYKIASGETIISGDAVRILDTGEIAKSKSLSDYSGTTIGIALLDGVGGDYVDVQLSGRVQNTNYNFGNLSGQVFARTNDSGSNISETILEAPSYTEDMVIWLGAVETENSFILNIQEFVFESGVLPPP